MRHLIRQIGQLTLLSPDPSGSARDLSQIVGLSIRDEHPDASFLSANDRAHEIVYARGSKPGVLAMGLEAMDDAALDEAKSRVLAEGLTIIDDKALWGKAAKGFRFKSSFGPIIEVHAPVSRSFAPRNVGAGARPTRLEHTNVRVPDVRGFGDMLDKLFGMRLSDRTEGYEIAWYRAWDGFHHTIAIGKGESSLHHYAFDANAIEHLVGIADTLALHDRELLWGPGRHGAGDNIFTYYLDPNGCVVETSVGMARIDNDDLYEPRVWSLKSRVRNLWGAPSSEAFHAGGVPFIETCDG